jgi:sulfur carrier protein
MTSMSIVLNGTPREVALGTTVADVVDELTGGRTGIAVAVNDDVLPRATWGSTRLEDADRVEVLTAVQGG